MSHVKLSIKSLQGSHSVIRQQDEHSLNLRFIKPGSKGHGCKVGERAMA